MEADRPRKTDGVESEVTTVQKFIDNNEDSHIRISQRFSRDSNDAYSETLWEGRLHSVPEEYRNLEVLGVGWLMAARIDHITVYREKTPMRSRTSGVRRR